MNAFSGLLRSALYLPASNERALVKAQNLPADAIIFDLEDAVAPNKKEQARDLLAQHLENGDYGDKLRVVRINGFDSMWGHDDARAVAEFECDAVLVPKVDHSGDIDDVVEVVSDRAIWCMVETPKSIINAHEIASHSNVEALVLGTNDLAKDLQCAMDGDRSVIMLALQQSVLAARAAGIFCLDGVYNAFSEDDGLWREATQGRALGMDGKTVIHPRQLDIVNTTFAPSAEEIDLAERQIAAFEEAAANDSGVAVLDGKIVEVLHVAAARRLIAQAEAIAAREAI